MGVRLDYNRLYSHHGVISRDASDSINGINGINSINDINGINSINSINGINGINELLVSLEAHQDRRWCGRRQTPGAISMEES